MAETGEERGRILIVDSDSGWRRALHGQLLTAGFNPSDADRPDEALALCGVSEFDLILLTAESAAAGIEACRLLRPVVPHGVLVVLAEFDKPTWMAEVLEAGADQCLERSLYVPELLAHVRALLRRTRPAAGLADASITIGEIRLDPVRRTVSRAGVPPRLSFKEFALLDHLMTHAGIPVDHAALVKAVWGEDYITRAESLRGLVLQLRRKLKDQITPQYLLTEGWVGYRFVGADEVPSNARSAGHAVAA